MKDLMKLKWEMHKGVNYIFYFIVIGLGILIGLGFKNFILPNISSDYIDNIISNIRNFRIF